MKTIVAIIALIAAATAALLLFQNDTARERGFGRAAGTLVGVQRVATRVWTNEIEAVGTAKANESVTLTAKVTDTVSRVSFEDGERVEAGNVLVALTNAEQTALLAEAEANLADARRQLERLENLVRQGSVPVSQVDEARTRVDAQKARLDALVARLDDRLIRAPFSGMLGFREVSEGTLVTPGTAIATLDDISVIKLDFSIPEVHLSAVAEGQRIYAQSPAWPDETFKGVIANIGSRVDPVTRSVMVRARVPNPEQILRPGMLLSVRLVTSEREALAVPERAVTQIERRAFVYVVGADGKAHRRDITLGARKSNLVEVVTGLEEGERVVTDGVIKLRDGAPVKTDDDVRPTSEPEGAPPSATRAPDRPSTIMAATEAS